MSIRVASMTNIGKDNDVNQDAVYAKMWLLSKCAVGVIAVADGMGGYENGEIAARIAVDTLDVFVNKTLDSGCTSVNHLSDSLDTAFLACHEKVQKMNLETGDKSGTTLTVCALLGSDYIIKNVGDTRCYIISSNGIQQISTDDSWVAQQVRLGLLTESDARKHKKQNLLTRCLGIGSDTDPHSSAGTLAKGQVLAVCSDGFYKMLDPDEMASAVAIWLDGGGNPLNAVLETLFSRNETDNISLCLMC